MLTIYVTGDTHGDFRRFTTSNFQEQRLMTKDDVVFICGDFGGIWKDSPEERYWLDWLNDKPFTTLYVDGNHENFDRYYGDEFETVDIYGGKAQMISRDIYHVLRGEVLEIQDKKFFAFGGASSHDVRDGILDPEAYTDTAAFKRDYARRRRDGQQIRVKGLSWWPQEIPSESEMQHGVETLERNDNTVDYVITHCLPQEVASVFSMGLYEPDALTMYFNKLLHDGLRFDRWYCGHYHINRRIIGKFDVLYDSIIRIV